MWPVKLKKRVLGKGDYIMISVLCIVVMVMCLWCIDISVSAMLSKGIMTNGFIERAPMQMYHVGLYGVICSAFVLVSIIVHVTTKEVKDEKV